MENSDSPHRLSKVFNQDLHLVDLSRSHVLEDYFIRKDLERLSWLRDDLRLVVDTLGQHFVKIDSVGRIEVVLLPELLVFLGDFTNECLPFRMILNCSHLLVVLVSGGVQ